MPVPRIVVRSDSSDYEVLAVNPAFKLINNLPSDEPAHQALFALIRNGNAKNKAILRNALEESRSTCKAVEIAELDMSSPELQTDSVLWWQIEILPVANELGHPEYLILSIRDVTVAVQAEKEMEEAQSREQCLHEELAATNEELLASNEELNSVVDDLNAARLRLEEFNAELENRVLQRTHELQEAQSVLGQQHHLLAAVIDEVPAGIVVFKGTEMTIDRINTKMLEMWKRGNEILGKPLIEVMPELKAQEFPKILQEVYATGIPYMVWGSAAELIIEGVRKTVYRDFSYTPLKDEHGKTHSIVALSVDVTERTLSRQREQQLLEEYTAINEELTAANEELAATNEELHESQESHSLMNQNLVESESRFRNLVMEAPVAICILKGEQLQLEMINAEGLNIFGKDGSILGRSLKEALPEPGARPLILMLKEVYRSGQPFSGNEMAAAFDHEGSVKSGYYSFICKPIVVEDGSVNALMVVATDVTERKKDEQRKNDFIGMVSHELKTPLTSLKGYAQILYARAQKAEDQFSLHSLGKVNDQVKKMTELINGFLNISRLESGKIQLNKQEFYFDDLVNENIEEAEIVMATHRIIFQPCERLRVYADREKVSSVVANLISNAIKYSPGKAQIEVSCQVIDEEIRFSVKDWGLGVRKEDQAKLFDRFYRVESRETQLISGFGIGLYLSAEIIERHGGRIWVESEGSAGSTFFFQLPGLSSTLADG